MFIGFMTVKSFSCFPLSCWLEKSTYAHTHTHCWINISLQQL